MQDREMTRETNLAEEYGALIRQLSGVCSAAVCLDEAGNISEIHVLAGSMRSPKQVMRDVESALAAAFGIQVDHRVISVAQLKQEAGPVEPPASPRGEKRLKCGPIEQSSDGRRYRARVTLYDGETPYEGQAVSGSSAQAKARALVQATLEAGHRFLGRDDLFAPLSVRECDLEGISVTVVVVECPEMGPGLLVGAAQNTGDSALCTVRATLDALNRRLSMVAGVR